MGLLRKYFTNMGNPKGFFGKMIVAGMNSGHSALSKWGFANWEIDGNKDVLDIGCGGGANLSRWLEHTKNGMVTGLDYSEVSVAKSKDKNKKAIQQGRCRVDQGNVRNLPYENDSFDYISAFETIYFWPEIGESFKEVHRILKPGGRFFICNEVDGSKASDAKWMEIIDGMTIYTDSEIISLLQTAGFSQIKTYRNKKKGWIAFSAIK